jgi:hypothetical protein
MNQIPTPPPTGPSATHEVHGEPPSDAGEPQGARDDRPAMLGWRFAGAILTGSLVGLALALAAHVIISNTVYDSTKVNGWSWVLAAIGGVAVGGACTLFIYGAATDRDDATDVPPRGQADVSERGEWRRTLDRRRRRARLR